MWRKIIAFLFDSAYQVVTWVWIAVSISSFFFFASNKSKNGMIGSAVSLIAAIILMLALMAKKQFWDGENNKRHIGASDSRGLEDRMPQARHDAGRTVAVESHVTPSVGIKVIRNAEQSQEAKPAKKVPVWAKPYEELTAEELAGPASGRGGSGAPPYTWRPDGPYDRIKWTDYTEDYFHDFIWRWEYKPQMGDKKPRNVTGLCPECENPLQKMGGTGKVDPKEGRTVTYYCPHHLQHTRDFQSPTYDDFDGIRQLITDKLNNGQWEEVVKRQIDVRDGRM